jgi:hypothetical protein
VDQRLDSGYGREKCGISVFDAKNIDGPLGQSPDLPKITAAARMAGKRALIRAMRETVRRFQIFRVKFFFDKKRVSAYTKYNCLWDIMEVILGKIWGFLFGILLFASCELNNYEASFKNDCDGTIYISLTSSETAPSSDDFHELASGSTYTFSDLEKGTYYVHLRVGNDIFSLGKSINLKSSQTFFVTYKDGQYQLTWYS